MLNTLLRYWDEPRDAGNFLKSPVFDTTLGFGGTGSGTGACVQNGPFKNMTVNIGPGFTTQPRCVNRQITNALSSLVNKAAVDKAIAPSTYEEAWISIYNGPHLGGHMALAMMVGNNHSQA
jgi:tyrosinase